LKKLLDEPIAETCLNVSKDFTRRNGYSNNKARVKGQKTYQKTPDGTYAPTQEKYNKCMKEQCERDIRVEGEQIDINWGSKSNDSMIARFMKETLKNYKEWFTEDHLIKEIERLGSTNPTTFISNCLRIREDKGNGKLLEKEGYIYPFNRYRLRPCLYEEYERKINKNQCT
jgi:hypothetical protein